MPGSGKRDLLHLVTIGQQKGEPGRASKYKPEFCQMVRDLAQEGPFPRNGRGQVRELLGISVRERAGWEAAEVVSAASYSSSRSFRTAAVLDNEALQQVGCSDGPGVGDGHAQVSDARLEVVLEAGDRRRQIPLDVRDDALGQFRTSPLARCR